MPPRCAQTYKTRAAAAPSLRRVKLSVHLVVPDASAAMDWYTRAFGARERSRIPPPGGTGRGVEMRVGHAVIHVASKSPGAGSGSPLTMGVTATVRQLNSRS